MGLDDEIRERFKDASDKLAEEVSSLAGQVADKAAPRLFRVHAQPQADHLDEGA